MQCAVLYAGMECQQILFFNMKTFRLHLKGFSTTNQAPFEEDYLCEKRMQAWRRVVMQRVTSNLSGTLTFIYL
jgi:hypothetical protein